MWPVVAFFLGGLATQLTATLNRRWQQQDKAAQDADQLRNRREEFELAHLVEVHGLLRAQSEMVWDAAHQLAQYRQQLAGALGAMGEEPPFPQDCIDSVIESEKAVMSQLGFILSDEVRRLVESACSAIAVEALDVLDEEPSKPPDDTFARVEAAHAALSARVREIYAGRAG